MLYAPRPRAILVYLARPILRDVFPIRRTILLQENLTWRDREITGLGQCVPIELKKGPAILFFTTVD